MFRPERLDRLGRRATATPARPRSTSSDELVAAAQAWGFHPDVSTTHLAAVVWASVHGLAQLWLQGALQGAGDHELEPTLRIMNELMLGVRADAPRARTRRRRTSR